MKRLLFIIALICAVCTSKAQFYQTQPDRDSSKMLIGFINDTMLNSDSSFKWFAKAQKIYKPKEAVVRTLAANKDSINLMIFLGTWCEDSRFVIPRFYKIIDSAGFNKDKIPLIAVDRTKKDNHHITTALHVTNVPTIIVFKHGKELGRVVEYGETGRYDEEVAALLK